MFYSSDVLPDTTLVDWHVPTVLMAVIILLETNWHNLSTLIEREDENFEQRC